MSDSPTVVIACRVSEDTREALRNVAAAFDLTLSDVVTAALDQYVLHNPDTARDSERAA